MRPVFAVALTLIVLSASRADEDARAIIKRAITAQGGPAAVRARAGAEHCRVKSKIYFPTPEDATPVGNQGTGDYFCEESGRRTGWTTLGGLGATPKAVFAYAVNGEKVWQKLNVTEAEGEFAAVTRENTYHDRIGKLYGLLDNRATGRGLLANKAFVFASLGESKVGGKSALGVRVSCKGHGDSLLYFDKVTGLLVKHRYQTLDPGTDDEKTTHELYYSDYRRVDFGSAHERILKESGIGTASQDLSELLRKRVPAVGAAKQVKEFIDGLGDDRFEKRERASKGLIELGAVAVPALRAAVKDPDREVASRARRCLVSIDPDRHERVLLAAVRLVGIRRAEGTCEPLLALLPGADAALAREVTGALCHLATRGGKPDPALVASLKDANAARRAAAEAALGKDGGKFARQAGRRFYPSTLLYPMKSTSYDDGKKTSESEVTEVEFFKRFDDALFAKP